jgi:hypothetical protein
VQAAVAMEQGYISMAVDLPMFHRYSTSDHIDSESGGSVLAHRWYPAKRKAQSAHIGFACALIAVFFLVSLSILQNAGYMRLLSGNHSSSLVGSSVTLQRTTPSAGKKTTLTDPYVVTSKPTITAGFINQVLAFYHSPAMGQGQALYDLGVHYHIDPAFALSLFMHESMFGTVGQARVTRSLGKFRCIPRAECITVNHGEYAKFNSWKEGFDAWYSLIHTLYVGYWGLTTVNEILPVYEPDPDRVIEASYVTAIKHAMDTWRAGIVQVA